LTPSGATDHTINNVAQTVHRSPVEGARRAVALVVGKVKRRRYPSRSKLLAMDDREFEQFLERTGMAQQVRDALAETEPIDQSTSLDTRLRDRAGGTEPGSTR
jgi:hypothetical protein